MVDQRGLSDDSGMSSTRDVNIEEFQTLTQRVATQKRQLEVILAILRPSVVTASVPSTARVTVTQEANTPVVTIMTTLPTTTAARPGMIVEAVIGTSQGRLNGPRASSIRGECGVLLDITVSLLLYVVLLMFCDCGGGGGGCKDQGLVRDNITVVHWSPDVPEHPPS
ncbi:hypothetical protein Sjap_012075 [Stephania japonica]|uniref:Uncharacterized protein n=1 Tax=Stephania japonica TaxID=461633 RepID=A0AAP0IVD5_9MAGN